MSDISTALSAALRVANSIHDAIGGHGVILPSSKATPLAGEAQHIDLNDSVHESCGLPQTVSESLSNAYLSKAEELRILSEDAVRTSCSKLSSLPRSSELIPLEKLYGKVFDAHHHRYISTISHWAQLAEEMAGKYLASMCPHSQQVYVDKPPNPSVKKSKRAFKAEYLPLFEFAFEKDRFPNREDKKHLAKISGMSYRQVCVWFQNRRCRRASRAKSHHTTPPPQTFEEMKERLSASAREALSKVPSAAEVFPRAHAAASSNSSVPLCTLKEEDILSPRPNARATSMGASEVSENGFGDEERYELVDDNDMESNNTMLALISSSSSSGAERTLVATNPLNVPKTLTATVFPAVYKPSKPTFDPFVVKHEPWLRSTQGPRTRELIEPTQEALEDMMQGFDSMEVDVPVFESEDPTSSTPSDSTERLEPLSPRRPTAPHVSPKSHPLTQRTFSSSSSESWSSGASAPLSRSSSYSTAPSSVLSSPQYPEASLPTLGECAVESPSEYVSSPSSPSADEGPVCDTLANDEVTRAGPLDLPSMKPASKARVDAWMSNLSIPQESDAAESKWEQLLAAAVEAAPQSSA